MKSIILTTIAAAVLAVILVLGGTAAFTNMQKVNAQMLGTSNMTGGMMGMKAGGGGPVLMSLVPLNYLLL